MVGEALTQILSPSFFVGLIIVGLILGLITRVMGNPIVKILIDVSGLIVIFIGFFIFIPVQNQHQTIQQGVDNVTNLMYYFINVVVPYLIGDAFTYIGYSAINPDQ